MCLDSLLNNQMLEYLFNTKLEMQNIIFYLQDDKWMQLNDAMSQMYLGHLTTALILFNKLNVYYGENA